MNKLDKVPDFDFEKIPSLSIVNFKDYASFANMLNGNYYVSGNKFLTKLYKSPEVNLVNHRFIKSLYYFDKTYALTKIEDSLNKLKEYSIYTFKDNFMVFTDKCARAYKQFTEHLKIFDTVYYKDEGFVGSNQEFMCFNSEGVGLYAEFSFINETIHMTDASIYDNIIYLKSNMTIFISDEEFDSILDTYFNMFNDPKPFYDERMDVKVTWSEYEYVLRVTGNIMNNTKYNDSDRTITYSMSDIKKAVTFSNYSVSDCITILSESLINSEPKIYEVMPFYEDVSNFNLTHDKI